MTNIRNQMIDLLQHTNYSNYYVMNSVGKLIAPINLTDELLNTQSYDKVEEYKTL